MNGIWRELWIISWALDHRSTHMSGVCRFVFGLPLDNCTICRCVLVCVLARACMCVCVHARLRWRVGNMIRHIHAFLNLNHHWLCGHVGHDFERCATLILLTVWYMSQIRHKISMHVCQLKAAAPWLIYVVVFSLGLDHLPAQLLSRAWSAHQNNLDLIMSFSSRYGGKYAQLGGYLDSLLWR